MSMSEFACTTTWSFASFVQGGSNIGLSEFVCMRRPI